MAADAPMPEEDRLRFATLVLGALDAPVTEGNMTLLLAWMYRENTGAKNNPFATTFNLDGSTQYNDAGVRNFATFEEGVEATVRTFDPEGVSETNPDRYNGIVAALRAGTSPQDVLDSDELKDELFTWGTFAKGEGENKTMSAGWAGASIPELRRSWENFRRQNKGEDLRSLWEQGGYVRYQENWESRMEEYNRDGGPDGDRFTWETPPDLDIDPGIRADEGEYNLLPDGMKPVPMPSGERFLKDRIPKEYEKLLEGQELVAFRNGEIISIALNGRNVEEAIAEEMAVEGTEAVSENRIFTNAPVTPIDDASTSLDDAIDEAEKEALGDFGWEGIGDAQDGKTPQEVLALSEIFGDAEYYLSHPDFVIERDGKMVNALWYAYTQKLRDPAAVKDLFQETEWWQTRNPTQREFDAAWAEAGGPEWGAGDVAFDPQNLTLDQLALLETKLDAIRLEAGQLGIDVVANRDSLLRMAYKASRMGMTPDEWKQEFVKQAGMSFDPDRLGGALATQRSFVETTNRKWMLPPGSSEEVGQTALDIYLGKMTQTNYNEALKEEAKIAYPTLAPMIDQGMTVEGFMGAYKTSAQTLLERPINFMGKDNSMFMHMISGGERSEGVPGVMSLWQSGDYVRNLPEWQTTKNAVDDAYEMASDFAQLFGGLGTPSYFRY